VTYVPTGASEDVLRYLAVGRQLGYAGYLSLDILTYVPPLVPSFYLPFSLSRSFIGCFECVVLCERSEAVLMVASWSGDQVI